MTAPSADSFSRTKKLFVDSGDASTFAEAEEHSQSFILQVHVGHIAGNATLQAAALTIVNSAARAFEGGVRVLIEVDCDILTGWQSEARLSEAVVAYSGTIVNALDERHPTVCVGDTDRAVRGRPVLRAVATGWSGGVVEGSSSPVAELDRFVPAGIAAGGIAAAEAFEVLRGHNIYAGRRSQGLSLWRPGIDWLSTDAIGPDAVTYGPAAWWIVGLGHLGQGYLWVIGMLPYANPEQVHVLMQDEDVVTKANESTGMLLPIGTVVNHERRRKTRELARVLECRGITTTITERRLRRGDGPADDEPRLALIGVDNPQTRRELSATDGFSLIVDVGLGGGPRGYLDLQLRSFPASRRSEDIPGWQDTAAPVPAARDMPAYSNAEDDECGIVELAGRSVAASFVGATAGALAVAEAVRSLRGEHRHEVVSASLHDLRGTDAVVTQQPAVDNPGFGLLR